MREVDAAIEVLWTLLGEVAPVIVDDQSLHGRFPDLADADSVLQSRAVSFILPNKAMFGSWLVDVVGDGTPFAADRGYYIDHVLVRDGLPILAGGWDARAIRRPMLREGVAVGEVRFLSPEDLVISKLGAGRPKDFAFVHELLARGLVQLADVSQLVSEVPAAYRANVEAALAHVAERAADSEMGGAQDQVDHVPVDDASPQSVPRPSTS